MSRPWIPRAPLVAAAVLACGALAGLALGAMQGKAFGVAFLDSFNDDVVGAIPWDLATAGQPVIHSQYGFVYGAGSDPRALIQVEQDATNPGNRVLRVSDAHIHDGLGHAVLRIMPLIAAGPGPVTFGCDVRLGAMGNETAVLSIVDNRTTPGTGRLVAIRIASDGTLQVNGQSAAFKLAEGKLYRFMVNLVLDVGPDTVSVRVCGPDGKKGYFSGPLPTLLDGYVLTHVDLELADAGSGSLELDNVRISLD